MTDLVRLITELEQRNIHFESLTEKIETSSPAGPLVFHAFAALADDANATSSANAPSPVSQPLVHEAGKVVVP